jgi:DNA-binding transcriptional LysR family regulator
MRPTDLLKHDICLYSAYPTRNRWVFRRGDEEVSIELPARVQSNSVHLLRDLARIGSGITCLPTLVCSEDLVSGALTPLLTDYEMPALELLAIYPVTHRGTVKVKLFVEFIRKRFSGLPEWDRALQNVAGFAPKAEANN